MKKFKFRLQKVLQYRVLVKDEKRRELLKKNLELQDARDRIESLLRMELDNRVHEGAVVSVEELYIRGRFAERLQAEIIDQRLRIVQLEEEVAEALRAYAEAAKDAKALETLKEKKHSEYMEYLYKEEGKFLDELAVQKGNRLLKEGERQ